MQKMSKISQEAREVYSQVYKTWKDATGMATVGKKGWGSNPADFNTAKRYMRCYWFDVFDGEKFPFKIVEVKGKRYTWIDYNGTTFNVNTEKGWQSINHEFSHYMSYKKYPKLRPHCVEQAWLELRGARLIVEKGLLEY